jgi:hypothetical protein
MKILIESIPHEQHRYPTCGDWWFEQEPGTLEPTLRIRVSRELPEKSQQLVALHELAEVMMCMANGVGQEEVDKFDMDFEKHRRPDDESEPGDHLEAPYHREHGYATAIERITATHMGVGWIEHEKAILDLFE